MFLGRKDFALGTESFVPSLEDDEIKGDANKTGLMSTGQNLHSGELFVSNKQKDGQTNMDERTDGQKAN
jgi:hypothetical protein